MPKIIEPMIPPIMNSAPNKLESESLKLNYEETYPTIVPNVLNDPFIYPNTSIKIRKFVSFKAEIT